MNPPLRRAIALAIGAAVLAWSPPPLHAGAGTERATVTPAPDMLGVRLGRAALERRAGRPRGVIENLEPLELSREPDSPEADRAAFLLAEAYLELGSRARFRALASDVARWSRHTIYTRWLAYQALVLDTEAGGAPMEQLGLLSEAGTEGGWASADTSLALGRDLAGAAAIGRARDAIANGRDPRPELVGVPPSSRYAARARHLAALATLERGDRALGRRLLEALFTDSPDYESRREVALDLAALALEDGRWQDAHLLYDRVDREWNAEAEPLRRLSVRDSLEALWTYWESQPGPSQGLLLDASALVPLTRAWTRSATDLGQRVDPGLVPLDIPQPQRSPWRVAPPSAEEWQEVGRSAALLGEAEHDWTRARWRVDAESDSLADLRRYLGVGIAHSRSEREKLASWSASLDSLRALLDANDAQLRRVRDEMTRRVAARASELAAQSQRQQDWMQAMERWILRGPGHAREAAPAAGLPSADTLVAGELALARAVAAAASALAADAPGWLERSYRQAWRPGLIGRTESLAAAAAEAARWNTALHAAVDSSRVQAGTSAAWRAAVAQAAASEGRLDSLRSGHEQLRTAIAARAVQRSLAALEAEREGIDYGLAASAYARSVDLAASDSLASRPALTTASAAATAPGGAEGDEADDPEHRAWRAEAVTALQDFLVRHPDSPARAEMRFRLADVLMVDARQAFRTQMAEYLRAQSEGDMAGRSLPVLTHAPALAWYRRILAEDPDFPRRDAVLFNAGMILADEGEPEAEEFFTQLVTQHPASPYGQEARLRLGDMAFDAREFPKGVQQYEHAARGPDPGLRVIALYKLGWAHFNEDRFEDAADAFRQVLDLYGSDQRAAIQAEIEGEANTYLLHSLAGAGGAAAFERYFDRIGARPYEKRVLVELGQHFRRYGELREASDVDALAIRRYPLEPEALLSATRLVETLGRSERMQEAREARRDLAGRFAQGSAWASAQPSDSTRAAGQAFAEQAWRSVAEEDHARARSSGARADWDRTRASYEELLRRLPAAADVPRRRMALAEAHVALGDYPSALQQLALAGDSDRDSIAAVAAWQRVAVTDAWYESSRAGRVTGPDSLAHLVLEAGDALLRRVPGHARAADVRWRESQLAIAHGWSERAADDLARMLAEHPGDDRTPLAAVQRGEALFRLARFAEAGKAFESAEPLARGAGRDSLAGRAHAALPVCAMREAEASVMADSSRHERHAELYERVAAHWPEYQQADLAQYRAALAWAAAGRDDASIRALRALAANFPRSRFARDARVQVATTLDSLHRFVPAAEAYVSFATTLPRDESAAAAWLRAAELFEQAGEPLRADTVRASYVALHPGDFEALMALHEARARRQLDALSADQPVSALLPQVRKRGSVAAPPSALSAYLALSNVHPRLASAELLARVRFLQGEEARAAIGPAPLVQPLAKSLAARQKLLDTLLVRYRRCADLGIAQWAHAAAFRIGEALDQMADAIAHGQRPADLTGDDLRAYEGVLAEQAQLFRDRASGVWSDLLRHRDRSVALDAWQEQAQSRLWKRLAERFYFHPEAEVPLLEPGTASRRDDARPALAGQDPGTP